MFRDVHPSEPSVSAPMVYYLKRCLGGPSPYSTKMLVHLIYLVRFLEAFGVFLACNNEYKTMMEEVLLFSLFCL